MTTAKKIVVKKTVAKKSNLQPDMRTIKKINEEQIQDVYIDGMSSLMAGPSISKISFYNTIEASETEETRKVSLRLVMPTDVMIDMVLKLRTSMIKNEKTLNDGLDSRKNKTVELMVKLKD